MLRCKHTPKEENVPSRKVLVTGHKLWLCTKLNLKALLPLLPNIPWSSLTDVCFLVMQVPTVRTRTVATIDVTIQGESASMSKKTKVLIEPPAFIHIIQTDKPIYKPGQTGKY